jgi:hypothetical protein
MYIQYQKKLKSIRGLDRHFVKQLEYKENKKKNIRIYNPIKSTFIHSFTAGV